MPRSLGSAAKAWAGAPRVSRASAAGSGGVKELDVGGANGAVGLPSAARDGGIPKLADVAWPLVRHSAARGLPGREPPPAVERQPLRRAVPVEKTLGEHGNVHLAFAQRRQPDGEGVDAVEIKSPGSDRRGRIARAGGWWPKMRRKSTAIDLLPPSRSNRALLEDAQELGLRDERHVADLRRETACPRWRARAPRLAIVRFAGECAFFAQPKISIQCTFAQDAPR